MHGDLSIRTIRTGSGATALQVVRYVKRKRVVIRHIGSASTNDELEVLWQKAEMIRKQLCAQLSFLDIAEQKPILHADHLSLQSIGSTSGYTVFSLMNEHQDQHVALLVDALSEKTSLDQRE